MHAALAYLTTNTGTPFHGFASLPLTLLISAVLASQFGTSVGAKTLTLKQAVLVSGVQGNHAWQLVIALPCFLVVLSLYFCPPCPQICVGRWPTIPCLSDIFPSFAIHLLPAACAPTLFPRPDTIILTAGLLLTPKRLLLPPYMCRQIAVVFEFVGAMVLGRVSTATISGGIAGGPCC